MAVLLWRGPVVPWRHVKGIVRGHGELLRPAVAPRGNCGLRRRGERVAGGKQRARHAHRRDGGRQPGDGEARHRRARGFADGASRAVLVATHPWTGKRRELLGLLVEHDLAVYSSHLPLDTHPRLGNNALLCPALGLKKLKPFLHDERAAPGFQATANVSRTELSRRLRKILGRAPVLLPGGPAVCRKIGVVTGGAGSYLKQAAEEGVNTFVTGEGPHHTYALAEELGLNVFYGGHYATETFGVKALAEELSRKFKVPWQFLDHPTGL